VARRTGNQVGQDALALLAANRNRRSGHKTAAIVNPPGVIANIAGYACCSNPRYGLQRAACIEAFQAVALLRKALKKWETRSILSK
jgi:hypothetical protein